MDNVTQLPIAPQVIGIEFDMRVQVIDLGSVDEVNAQIMAVTLDADNYDRYRPYFTKTQGPILSHGETAYSLVLPTGDMVCLWHRPRALAEGKAETQSCFTMGYASKFFVKGDRMFWRREVRTSRNRQIESLDVSKS